MAEEKSTEQKNAPQFMLQGQYVKDLSFENPHVPQSLMNLNEPPKIEMNVNLGAGKLQDDLYELTMHINVRANGERTLFLTDLSYAGMFVIRNVPEENIEQLLLVDCAFILYPFARRVVSDVTRDGGFPPLLLEPIDFFRLYQDRK